MFARIYTAAILALPLLVAATSNGPSNQCNTGEIQCCNSVHSASNPTAFVTGLLNILGVVVGDANAQIGVTCSPITVVGAGATSCAQQPVCCTNNSFNGVVAIGCSPIDL